MCARTLYDRCSSVLLSCSSHPINWTLFKHTVWWVSFVEWWNHHHHLSRNISSPQKGRPCPLAIALHLLGTPRLLPVSVSVSVLDSHVDDAPHSVASYTGLPSPTAKFLRLGCWWRVEGLHSWLRLCTPHCRDRPHGVCCPLTRLWMLGSSRFLAIVNRAAVNACTQFCVAL